jgi:hypothetical protein
MHPRLRARLNAAATGKFADEDSPARVCQDALTALMRAETDAELLDNFLSFVRGWVLDNELPVGWTQPIRDRIKRIDEARK